MLNETPYKCDLDLRYVPDPNRSVYFGDHASREVDLGIAVAPDNLVNTGRAGVNMDLG
jgi:hypothetical protein